MAQRAFTQQTHIKAWRSNIQLMAGGAPALMRSSCLPWSFFARTHTPLHLRDKLYKVVSLMEDDYYHITQNKLTLHLSHIVDNLRLYLGLMVNEFFSSKLCYPLCLRFQFILFPPQTSLYFVLICLPSFFCVKSIQISKFCMKKGQNGFIAYEFQNI